MRSHDTVRPVPGAALGLDAPERRLLARMRLHAITAVHGEAGLRERLLIEAGRFPAADRARIEAALPYTTGAKLPVLAAKYLPLVAPLRELVLRADTPLDVGVKDMIVRQLDNAEGTLSAICG